MKNLIILLALLATAVTFSSCSSSDGSNSVTPQDQLLGNWNMDRLDIKTYEDDNLINEVTQYYGGEEYYKFEFYDYTGVIIDYKNQLSEGKDSSVYSFDGEVLYLVGSKATVKELNQVDLKYQSVTTQDVSGVEHRTEYLYSCSRIE